MIEKEITWDLTPNISVGVFKFQTSINPLISKLNLLKLNEKQGEWDGYEIPDCETRVYADDNGIIECVGCYDNLYYEGKNLFGLKVDEIRKIIGEEGKTGKTVLFDFKDNEFEKTPIEFEQWGLEIWFKNGIVESVSASNNLQYI